METVVLDGMVYTKASVLAKRFRYTNDYIGQLCRSGKIKAELVGRTWYALESDLLAHKDTRYKQLREDEITNKIKVHEEIPRESAEVEVRPRMSKKTVRNISITTQRSTPVWLEKLEPAKYLPDEAELVPKPKVEHVEPREIKVDLESAQKVKVKAEGPKKMSLEFTELPTVQLQGNLKIQSVELAVETSHNEPVYAAVPAVQTPKAHLPETTVVAEFSEHHPKASFTPRLVAESQTEVVVMSTRFPIVLVAFLSALFIFSLLTLTESNLHFEGGMSATKVSFDAASLPFAFEVFRDLFSPQF